MKATGLPGNAARALRALRNLVMRRWGRNITHANYRPLLGLP